MFDLILNIEERAVLFSCFFLLVRRSLAQWYANKNRGAAPLMVQYIQSVPEQATSRHNHPCHMPVSNILESLVKFKIN